MMVNSNKKRTTLVSKVMRHRKEAMSMCHCLMHCGVEMPTADSYGVTTNCDPRF